MTFPRRLTPSNTERATIVQQRMTPGAALGVGSRHVRSNDSSRTAVAGSGGGGPVAAIRFTGRSLITFADTLYPYTADAAVGDTGSYWSYDPGADAVDVYFQQAGWYQIGAEITVQALTAGDTVTIELDNPGPETLNASYTATSTHAYPRVTSVPFYLDDAGGYSVQLRCGTNSAGGTILDSAINLVAFG